MSQSLEECKNRLASIHSYRRQFAMVTKATVTSSKTLDFGFRGPLGFEAQTVLAIIESDSPDQIAFESAGGNIDLMGLIEFEEVRPDCTEITFAVHYEIKSKCYAWLDRRFGFVDDLPDLRVAQPAFAFRRHCRPGEGARTGLRDFRAAFGLTKSKFLH